MEVINTQSADKIQWYVMRVYKREREVEEILTGPHGIEHFIAKKNEIRTYQGVKHSKVVPAIPSIVFIHANRRQIREFKNYCPYLSYCFWSKSGKIERPLVIPNREMENFIIIAKHYEEDIIYFKPEELQLEKGTKVRVHGGAFDGLEGTLLKIKKRENKRIVVRLEGLATVASSQIEPDLVEIVE